MSGIPYISVQINQYYEFIQDKLTILFNINVDSLSFDWVLWY